MNGKVMIVCFLVFGAIIGGVIGFMLSSNAVIVSADTSSGDSIAGSCGCNMEGAVGKTKNGFGGGGCADMKERAVDGCSCGFK